MITKDHSIATVDFGFLTTCVRVDICSPLLASTCPRIAVVIETIASVPFVGWDPFVQQTAEEYS